MGSSEPTIVTVEQAKKFWDRFGLDKVKETGVLVDGKPWYQYPPIDLKNIIQYVAPKLGSRLKIEFRLGYPFMNTLYCSVSAERSAKRMWGSDCYVSIVTSNIPTEEDYALALFWAIYKMAVKGKED